MIMLKSPEEIEHMRRASGIVAEILAEVAAHVRPGVSTAELDALAEELTRKHGSKPAFKGYVVGGRSFPATICISVNDEVVHGSRPRAGCCARVTSSVSTSACATRATSATPPGRSPSAAYPPRRSA
jgi:methionyl aminopeptidase